MRGGKFVGSFGLLWCVSSVFTKIEQMMTKMLNKIAVHFATSIKNSAVKKSLILAPAKLVKQVE